MGMLIDRPDMTFDVYRGRKTTMQIRPKREKWLNVKVSTALKYYRSILPLQKLYYQHKNIAIERRKSSQNATRANLMLLISNMENVSQGPLLINHQCCTSSGRIFIFYAIKMHRSRHTGIP